ncbi:MAG TPA: hypothetical protein VFI02_18040 [Armatimonadota bacterium]|nr:hypothetical protein [Armatimonadota bacterium]
MTDYHPGPYVISNLLSWNRALGGIGERGDTWEIWSKPENRVVARIPHRVKTKEADEATAYLLAAAPLLYKALFAILCEQDDRPQHDETRGETMAHAALAEARGNIRGTTP